MAAFWAVFGWVFLFAPSESTEAFLLPLTQFRELSALIAHVHNVQGVHTAIMDAMVAERTGNSFSGSAS
eukprot:145386-Rhodomonas_salina.1